MAISKLILNGEVQMDVTSDTVTAGSMLSGTTATKNDGTKATGTIVNRDEADLYDSTSGNSYYVNTPAGYYSSAATYELVLRSAANLTASGATVTAPAGYYANTASKAVATTTHPNPSATITSSTGVVTASHTQTAGYVTAGTTTSTINLTSKAAATYYPSTADQTISSYRWLTGAQTIKSVVTSNLTAANIAEGVVIKVGDSSNASRITQVTGTYKGGIDIPVFTLQYTMDGQLLSVTCSETYAECRTRLTNNDPCAHAISAFPNGEEYGYPLSAQQSTSNTIIYVATGGAQPFFDIIYHSDGTIDVVDPSSYATSLSVTSNGVYVPDNNGVYTDVTVSVPSGGGFTADQIAMGTISGSINGNATSINSYAFYTCSSLTAASFPLCTYIGNYAFHYCSGLSTVSFPVCTSMGNYAFASCHSLSTVSFPSCTSIGTDAFASCYSLSTVSFPVCTSIGNYAFYYCSSLTAASFPLCTYVGAYAFYYCYSLSTVSFPSCTYIASNAFYSCINLTAANFPLVSVISGSAFRGCSAMTTASFPSCRYISNYAFYTCSRLVSLYLLTSTVPTLGATNTFTNASSIHIYVPASLYTSYITATNWVSMSSYIYSV